MDAFMIVFRLLHIASATFWTGAAIFVVRFLMPAVREAGPAGAVVMQKLLGGTKYLTAIAHAAAWTVISGMVLLWKDSAGFDPEWMMSATGMIFVCGGIAGIVAAVIGLLVMRPASLRIVAIGRAVEAAGGPPSAEQQAEVGALVAQVAGAGKAVVALTMAGLVAMSAARYVYR